MDTGHPGAALAAGLALTDLNVHDLWVRYFALGGSHSSDELGRYLRGQGEEWGTVEHDAAAHAINEETGDHGLGHPASYAEDL